MGTTAPDPAAPEIAQPAEGQGDSAPYAEFLERIPEGLRGDVEPVFKEWDANVTRRFQDHAEFRKQWEPLADTGISQLDPSEVSWLVQFRQALDDPQTMQQWWQSYAQQNGLTVTEAQQQQPSAEPALDEYGYQDATQLQKLLDERLGPLATQIEQFNTRFAQADQAQAEAEAGRFIEGQIAELKAKHGDFSKDTEELINTLAGAYIESDPMNAIPRAWEDLQRWRNNVEKEALQAKVTQPAPAEGGGIPAVSPETHRRIDAPGVKDAAIEFLRNSNRA